MKFESCGAFAQTIKMARSVCPSNLPEAHKSICPLVREGGTAESLIKNEKNNEGGWLALTLALDFFSMAQRAEISNPGEVEA